MRQLLSIAALILFSLSASAQWATRDAVTNIVKTVVTNGSIPMLRSSNKTNSVYVEGRELFDSSNNVVVDWQQEILSDNLPGGAASVLWKSRLLQDTNGVQSLDWNSRKLLGSWSATNLSSLALTNLAFLNSSNTTVSSAAVTYTNNYYPTNYGIPVIVTNVPESTGTNVYFPHLTNGTIHVWTNKTGFALAVDTSGADMTGGYSEGASLALSNLTDLLYFAFASQVLNGQQLQQENGSGNPSIVLTNLVTELVYAPYITFNGGVLAADVATNLIYVDPINGDDRFGGRGKQALFKTIVAALGIAKSNDVIILPPGLYADGGFVVPDGVHVKGAGRGITRIGVGASGSGAISVGSYSVLRDFSFYGVIGGCGNSNIFENLDITGAVDAWFADLQASTYNRVINCKFQSTYDCFNNTGLGTPIPVIEFENCQFTSVNAGAGTPGRGLSVLANINVRLFGGSIEVVNYGTYNGTTGGVCIAMTSPSSKVELSGVRLSYPTTNATPEKAVYYAYANGTNVFTYGRLFHTNDVTSGTVTIYE